MPSSWLGRCCSPTKSATTYFNCDEAKASEEREKIAKDPNAAPAGDVAAFEVNRHDFADDVDALQAKTGLKVKVESVSH